MSALMTLTVTTRAPPLSRVCRLGQGIPGAALRDRNLLARIAADYRRIATGQCYERGRKVSRRGPAPPPRPPRNKEHGTRGAVCTLWCLFPYSLFQLPQHRRRQAPRGAPVLFVPRRLRAREQLLHLPSQRRRPLLRQRLGERLVALELAGPLAAALGDVPVAEGAAAHAEQQVAKGRGHRRVVQGQDTLALPLGGRIVLDHQVAAGRYQAGERPEQSLLKPGGPQVRRIAADGGRRLVADHLQPVVAGVGSRVVQAEGDRLGAQAAVRIGQ